MQKTSLTNIKFIMQSLLVIVGMLLSPTLLIAAQLNLSTKPMYIGNTALPNLVFTMDDSGSMGWDYMPDEANDNGTCKNGAACRAGDPPYYANAFNRSYYNPATTYSPAVDWDGTSRGDYGSPWTAVDVDHFGIRSSSSINLTGSFPDTEYFEVVYSGADMNDCGTSPSVCKAGNIVTMIITAHGLNTGDVIDITNDDNDCDNDIEATNRTVTVIDANTFSYDEGGSGGYGNTDCRVFKSDDALQHGIDTTGDLFEYRVAPSGENPLVHGFPSSPYTLQQTRNTNAFYYTIVPTEYCSDAALTTCVASMVPTGANIYPAPVRFCTSRANADADVPVSDGTRCQGKETNTFDTPRYGKFYRHDIVPATASYQNLFVNAAGTVLESGNASETGYTLQVDRSARTDCTTALSCTYAEEMTNFANWYAYFRLRTNSMKTSVGKAFAELDGANMRIGYGRINRGSSTIDGASSPGTMQLGVRQFVGTAKQNWFTALYNTDASGSTPLRQALDDVGVYYSRSDSRGPWGTYPEDSATSEISSAHASCRQSYTLLSSDGYWNSSTARGSARRANVDNTNGPVISTPSSWANTAEMPYSDNYSSTLADVAMYYWKNDLRTNIDNIVETNTQDDAFWQHMVTFTLGFGLEGELDPATDLPALTAGTKVWPQASTNQIDDMWHSAVNGRGTFFSVDDPDALVTSLRNVFADISDRTGSAASVAIDTAVTQTNRAVYQAKFNSGFWTGSLTESPIDLDTGVIGAPAWNALTQVTAQNYDTGRFVATWDPGSGAGSEFRWANLTATQQADLNKDALGTTDGRGSERVDFIRGDRTVTGFRPRTAGVLGDIVHSSPAYVAGPVRSYTSSSYQTFKSSNSSRTPVVYVGANDGMLHAFDASNGNELFAYVPNVVIDQLSQLTSTTYVHQYYVDGPVTVEDVQVSGVWKTALVGALGAGGKAVYALDITNPVLAGASVAAKETDLSNKVLWEYTEADLGLVHGEIAVAKMSNGVWAAIFGNGYNNTGTGKAAVYVVNIGTGALIKKFVVGGGTVATPSGMLRHYRLM